MYGAYYPYLYGRGARSFHHAPHFQYERLNVQSGGGHGSAGAEVYGGGAGGAGLSSGSSGAHSPASPPHAHLPPHARLRAKEELSAHGRTSADVGGSSESEGECGGGAAGVGAGGGARAQYVSANCVVFTHYSGDVAAVVDEHFSRALSLDKPKESVPMVSRNLPASFFNAAACGGGGGVGAGMGGGVGGMGGSCGGGVELYEYDPWHGHYGGYGQYHAHYPGLLLGRPALHAQYKPVDWQQHPAHLDPAACATYSYPPVPGLEAQVQDTSKDLYWF